MVKQWQHQLSTFVSQPTRAGWLVLGLSVLSLIFWGLLYRWYALFVYYDLPLFALDKVAGHFDSPVLRWTTLFFVALAAIYTATYWLIRKTAVLSATMKWGIVLAGSGGLINIIIYPVRAIDLFVYLIELKLIFFYQQNPYLVTFLPDYATDPWAPFGSLFLKAPMVYGPGWAIISRVPTWFSGFEDLLAALIAYKAFSFLFVVLGGWFLYMYQDDDKMRWLTVYLFVANPLVLFESVANAHNDVMVAVFLFAALLAYKRRSWLTFPLLMVSALIKFFALPLMPLFLWQMVREKWRWQQIAISSLSALVLLITFISPFWADGEMLLGMSHAIRIQQTLKTSSIFSLVNEYLTLWETPDSVLTVVRSIFIGFFLVLSGGIMVTMKDFVRGILSVLLLFYLLVSSLFLWYLIPVIGLLALSDSRNGRFYLIIATLLGVLLNTLSVWSWFNAGFTHPFQIRLFQSLFSTAPILLFLFLEYGRRPTVAAKR